MGIVKIFRVGKMGVGEMGQIIGETGVGKMGVGKMGVILLKAQVSLHIQSCQSLCCSLRV